MSDRRRTLSYLRTIWRPQDERPEPTFTLQDVVTSTLDGRRAAMDTMVPLREGHAAICHRKLGRDGRLFIHVAAWTDRQPASTVPHVGDRPAVGLDLNPPGEDWEYLGGDGHLLTWGNHCVMLPSGLHPKSLERYVKTLLTDSNPGLCDHELVAVANPQMIQRLINEGVKRIGLHIGAYPQTTRDWIGSRTIPEIGRDVYSRLFQHELGTYAAMEAATNLNMKLELAVDNRRRPGIRPEDLAPVAQRIVEEDDGEYMDLVTARGYRIRRRDLLLRKPVDVPAHGSTIRRRPAWILMDEYLDELMQQGALEE